MSISTANPQLASFTKYRFVAVGSETSVSGVDANGSVLSYTPGLEQVYLNGVMLVRGSDYTATTGTSVTALAALTVNDIVEILTFTPFVITNAVDQTLVNAKGDLIVGTADNIVTNLAVGNNGESLVADNSISTGLRWQGSMAAGKNGSINGGFDIWQRGTSFSASSPLYTADRWSLNASSAHTLTRQTVSDTTNLPTIQYCARIQRTNGTLGASAHYLTQSLESRESYRYAGQTVTLSFYARKGANFSSTYLQSWVYYGTGTDEAITGTYTGAVGLGGQNNTLTTTWQRFTMTVSIDKSATELALFFAMESTGTSGAADYFEITGVQLELGSTATTFSRAGGTIQGELAACQRYFQKSYEHATAPATVTGSGAIACMAANPADRCVVPGKWVVTMRTAPTVTIYSQAGTSGKLSTTAGTDTGSSVVADNIGESGMRNIYSATGLTTSALYYFHFVASAEL